MVNNTQMGALETVFRNEVRPLRQWLASRVGDHNTAEDISQAALLAVWTRAQKTTIDNPKALMFKVARDLMVNEYKRRARHAVPFSAICPKDYEDKLDAQDECVGPEEHLLAKQELAVILKQIDTLPPNCRTAFKLNRFDGKNYEEIAATMGVSVSSVEKFIMRALKILRATRSQSALKEADL